jgi:hypothetical protein
MFLLLACPSLMGVPRFLYDKKDASFMDLPPVDANVMPGTPHNCAICARREEEAIQVHGRIIRRAGAATGVAIHGATLHVGDFALLRAEQGPARIVQIIGLYSGDPMLIRVQLLGRVSDLPDWVPASELRDEVCCFGFLYSPTELTSPSSLLASSVLHG